jgi:hypothetical protein
VYGPTSIEGESIQPSSQVDTAVGGRRAKLGRTRYALQPRRGAQAMNQRNMDKSDATPAVSDRVSVVELKSSPETVGINRPLAIPSRQVRSHTPPSCPRLSEFNAIHSNKGDRNG